MKKLLLLFFALLCLTGTAKAATAELSFDELYSGGGLLEQMHVCPTRKVRALSRGEKQRVAIARAVLLKPGIILADEPTASLDEANAGQVSLLLSGYARTLGSTLLVVSHDDAVLADMDRVLDLNRGIVREAA